MTGAQCGDLAPALVVGVGLHQRGRFGDIPRQAGGAVRSGQVGIVAIHPLRHDMVGRRILPLQDLVSQHLLVQRQIESLTHAHVVERRGGPGGLEVFGVQEGDLVEVGALFGLFVLGR